MLLVRNNSRRPITISIPTGYDGPQPFYAADRSTRSMQINPGQVTSLTADFATSREARNAIEGGDLEVLKEYARPGEASPEVHANG